MIPGDALKAIGQMGDPAFRRVLLRGLALTVGLFAAVAAIAVWGITAVLPETLALPLIGEVAWLDDLAAGTVIAIVLLGSVVFMVPVASAFVSMFLDEVAGAVERKHYPALPPARGQPVVEAILDGIRFLGVIVAANLAAILVYALVPPAAPLIFLAMNGYLLGREYFQLVALRRVSPDAARTLRQRHAGQIWLAGMVMALPLTVPVVNLLVPVLGAATFTHLYQRLAERPS